MTNILLLLLVNGFIVILPDICAVGAVLSELEAEWALGLCAVRADRAGVVVAPDHTWVAE